MLLSICCRHGQCSQSASRRLNEAKLNGAELFNPAAWLAEAELNGAGLFRGMLLRQPLKLSVAAHSRTVTI